MKNIIKEIQFDNFDSFVKAISYGGEIYNTIYPNFIFRGESSGKFKLIPSALREDNRNKVMRLGNCNGLENQMMRIAAEYNILRKFYYSCDDANLYVPNCRIRKYPIDDVSVFLNHETWLPEDLYEITGLAQHYGLPTRLLDWSKDIYVSLYFACLGVMNEIKKGNCINDDNIVLWALNAKKIESDKSIGKMIPLKFIKPSYHGNPNLGAQKGLFTLWEFVTDEQRQNKVEVTPLDTFLINKAIDDQTLLYKLTLPTKFVLCLYVMLRNLGYDASRIFPGYNGVSQLISEDLLYKQIYSIIVT